MIRVTTYIRYDSCASKVKLLVLFYSCCNPHAAEKLSKNLNLKSFSPFGLIFETLRVVLNTALCLVFKASEETKINSKDNRTHNCPAALRRK